MLRPADVPLLARAKSWYDGLPYFTRIVTVLLLALFVVGALTGYDDYAAFCLNAQDATVNLQAYRLLTAPLLHLGLLHVGFNLLTFVPLGHVMERSFGTLQFAYMVALMMILPGLLYVVLEYVMAFLGLPGGGLSECMVGFSGVLFGLIVIDNASNSAPTRSLFGLVEVPALIYPWALLFIVQMIPGVSFLGHLTGLLAGYVYALGFLQPSRQFLMELEGSSFAMQYLTRNPSFMMVPGPSLPVAFAPAGASAPAGQPASAWAGSAAGGWLSSVARLFQRGGGAGAEQDLEDGAPLLQGGGAAAPSAATAPDKAFQGKGHQLGASAAGSASAQAPAALAAAAAAESRVARSSGLPPPGASVLH